MIRVVGSANNWGEYMWIGIEWVSSPDEHWGQFTPNMSQLKQMEIVFCFKWRA